MKERTKDFVTMTGGTLLVAAGIYFFKIPNGFTTGGVSGLAILLSRLIPVAFFSPGRLILGINLLLLALGWFLLGKAAILRTLYCGLLYSIVIEILELLLPLASPLTDEPFLELIWGILLTSIGTALLFHVGASSGGTDIVALVLKKYTSLDAGIALLLTDSIIALSSFFVFDLRTGLFSVFGLFTKSFLIDGVIDNIHTCKAFIIITSRPAPILRYIMEGIRHSATTVDARGEYTKEPRKMIFTLCRRYESPRLKRKIRELDPDAFVIIESTSDIVGRGFRAR